MRKGFRLFSFSPVINSALLFLYQKWRLPQTLVYFVTSRCNAKCDFCLYKEHIDNPVKQKEELTVDEIKKISAQYGPLHYLALSGGEPFLRKDLDGLVQAFIDNCGVKVVDIPSNFYYGDRMFEILSRLVCNNPGVIFDIQLSIDQTGEKHDISRKVENLYETALASFRKLEELRDNYPNLRLKVNIVYLNENKNDIPDIQAELLKRINPERISLTFPNYVISSSGNTGMQAVYEHYYSLAEDCRFQGRSFKDIYTVGMRSAKKYYHRLLRSAISGTQNMGNICHAGEYVLVMNEKGDIFPCEGLWHKIGNVRENDYSIPKVLKSDDYKEFKRKYIGSNKCNCTWGCAAMSAVSVTPLYVAGMCIESVKIILGDVFFPKKQKGRNE